MTLPISQGKGIFQISFSVLGYITTYICFATVFGPRKTTVLESEETKKTLTNQTAWLHNGEINLQRFLLIDGQTAKVI